MNKILIIAWREFIETVKTKAFFFGVVLMPALIVGVIFLSERLSRSAESEKTPAKALALRDEHGAVFAEFEREVAAFNKENPQRPFELKRADPAEASSTAEALSEQTKRGDLYAFLIVPQDAVDAAGECTLGRKDSQLSAGRTLQDMLQNAIVNVRCLTGDPPISSVYLARLQRPVAVANIDLTSGEKKADDQFARVLTPFIFMFLIYMGTFGISMGLLTSVLEEKSSRVVEVLLAAVSPTQLMAGKILGMAAVGMVVLGSWIAVGYFSARANDLTHLVSGDRLVYVALYFVPAFLFMSALLAGIGSTCNTLKEAQSMVSPLSIINIVPMVLWFNLSQYPNSALAVTLSFIPPITPFVMILRICADPDLPKWQIWATVALMWLSVIATIWAAAKVFRVGVLMYGKAPSIRELLRWVRYA